MGAHGAAVRDGRKALIGRATQQLDSIGPAIAAIEHAVEAGQGDILAQRRLRTLLSERQRLQAVIDQDRERRAEPGAG